MIVSKEHSLGFWCARIRQQYFDLLSERLRHLGLERGYFTLLLIVENDGRVSQQELADALHMDKVAMARSIDHLCERGYVQRSTCPEDRRKHHLTLMPKAIPAAKEIKLASAALDRLAFKDLNTQDRGHMFRSLRGPLDNLHGGSVRTASKTKKQRTN